MAKTEPLVLTKEQAEAIQTLNRLSGGKDDVLKQKALGRVWGRDLACIDSLSLDELAHALYVGYTVEKTQEERYAELVDEYNRTLIDHEYDYAAGMRCALDILGITIEGVND